MIFKQSSTVMRAIEGTLCLSSADRAAVTGRLAGKLEPFGPDNAAQIQRRPVEIFVNNNIVILVRVTDFGLRRRESARDDIGAVLTAVHEAGLEHFERWGADKNAHHVRHQLAHLLRTLPVDFEQHVAPGIELLLDPRSPSTVAVTVDLGVLQELSSLQHALELRQRHEVVMLAIDFARAGRTGRMRY